MRDTSSQVQSPAFSSRQIESYAITNFQNGYHQAKHSETRFPHPISTEK